MIQNGELMIHSRFSVAAKPFNWSHVAPNSIHLCIISGSFITLSLDRAKFCRLENQNDALLFIIRIMAKNISEMSKPYL